MAQPINRPADSGVTYRLTFLEQGRVVVRADVDGSGCGFVRLSDGERLRTLSADRTGPVFDELLARPLGLSLRKSSGHPLL